MESPIVCNHCGYRWITKSLNIYVSCPSCLQKVKRADNIVREQPVNNE